MKYTRKVRFSYTTNCGAEYRTTWKCLPLVLFLFTLPHFLLLDWNNAFDTLDLCFSFSGSTYLCCLLNVFLFSFISPPSPSHLLPFLHFHSPVVCQYVVLLLKFVQGSDACCHRGFNWILLPPEGWPA